MRPIKFRAWATKQKKMYYDVGFCSRDIEVYWYDPKLEEETVLGDRQENSLLQYTILMQYTGLKDKSGKEIYEDDFLGYNNYVYRVYYNEHIAAYGLIAIGNEAACSYPKFGEAEVVGNAFENPKLLEEK